MVSWRPRSPLTRPRRAAAVNAGKLVGFASRVLGRGGGTALPGVVATRVYGDVARDLAGQLECGSFLVSGTNGKTTTSRMLASILTEAGYAPVRNESGSNLMRGVASSLVQQSTVWGNVRRRSRTLGLFEADEAALPALLRALRPRGVLLLDLFRDQLDRYGEVATVARLWSSAMVELPSGAGIIANADDPLLAEATAPVAATTFYFGIESSERTIQSPEHASDVKACPRCGNQIRYSEVFLGHLGKYACPNCGLSRPAPSVWLRDLQLDGIRGSQFQLCTASGWHAVSLPLPGTYNAYNAVAAAAAATWLGIDPGLIVRALSNATPAFGRMERIAVDGRRVYLALAKNPAGLNEVLRTALQGEASLHLLLMLNDRTADGRDVSWIWDADLELLAGRISTVVFGGTRAADMGLRCKYAGVIPSGGAEPYQVEEDTEAALRQAVALTPPGEDLIVIPTYTALLDVRDTMAKLGYVRPYWEE